MDGFEVRLRRVARRGMRVRLIAVVWNLGFLPVAIVLVYVALGSSARPWFHGLSMGLMYIVLCGGQAWKNPERARALLDEGEELVTVFPVGSVRTSLPRRLVGAGGFLVVTNQRVLVFAHNRITDVATDLLWSAPRRGCAAELGPQRRQLRVFRGEESGEWRIGYGARHRAAVERFVVAINRGWW